MIGLAPLAGGAGVPKFYHAIILLLFSFCLFFFAVSALFALSFSFLFFALLLFLLSFCVVALFFFALSFSFLLLALLLRWPTKKKSFSLGSVALFGCILLFFALGLKFEKCEKNYNSKKNGDFFFFAKGLKCEVSYNLFLVE